MKKATIYTVVLATACLTCSTAMARPWGVDVNEDGNINWTTAAGSGGVAFAWVKATEGTYYENANYDSYMSNGKNAGVYMGAYDFARPDEDSPSTETSYFLNYATGYITTRLSLAPALDFEVFNGVKGASTYTAWCTDWVNNIKSMGSGKGFTQFHPALYCSACSGACELGSGCGANGWIANYNGETPGTGTPWNECTSCDVWNGWSCWQFTSTQSVAGIPGNSDGYCDRDVMNVTSIGNSSFVIQ